MEERETSNEVKYLVSTEEDELWGLSVTSVGSQTISANESYPPSSHPQGYFFNVNEGRILSEYQLLYITDGEGIFTYGESRESQLITEGKMFFLFPGVWHTYRPFDNSGWKEYWIGFKGETIDRIVAEGFFLNQAPVFNIGLNERIIDLYIKALDIANEERSGYQQALAGIVMHMVGLMYYRHRTRDFVDEEMINKMNKAKVIMREGVYDNLSAKEV
ncbi:MAG: AraC family ligand binding domain-containing protein, partial [Alistipes sp.]|nr:AraC family ligand binding domain-containing protein [Alistipes sp.]